MGVRKEVKESQENRYAEVGDNQPIPLLYVLSGFSCLTFCDPMNCSLPHSSIRGISRQEYWSGLPCLPPGDLPDPGIEPISLRFPELAGRFFATSATWKTPLVIRKCVLMLNQSISPGNFSYPVVWSCEE